MAKIVYYYTDTVTVNGSITLDQDTITATVLVEIRKSSDDSLISTLLNTTYNFTANTATTLQTINSGTAVTWTPSATGDFYSKVTISGGTPVIDTDLSNVITEYFTIETQYYTITQNDVATDKTWYSADLGETVSITGGIQLNTTVTTVSVTVGVYKKSDDSLISTIVNKTANFVAAVAQSLTTINGATPTFTTSTKTDYYVKTTISGGSVSIDPYDDNTATANFVFGSTNFNPEVLNVTTDKVAYLSNIDSTITIIGTVETDIATTSATVSVGIYKLSDDSLISTLMNKAYSFSALTPVSLYTINGSTLTTTVTIADNYYVRLGIGGGSPSINSSTKNFIINDFRVDTGYSNITQLDLTNNKSSYYTTDIISISATINLNITTTGTNVLLETRKKSDDSLVATVLNMTYNFIASTPVTLYTIVGYAVTTSVSVAGANDYYSKLTISGGTPTINSNIDNTVSEYFTATTQYPNIILLDVTTDYSSYKINSPVNVDGTIEFDTSVATVTVAVIIKRKSDNVAVQTLLNAAADFTANTSRTLTNINGSQLIFVPVTAQDYYADLTVSGGSPAIDITKTDNNTTFGFSVSPVKILQLDVETDAVAYGAGDTITVTGNIKLDTSTSNTSVLLEVRYIVDDSLIATLLDTTSAFTANTSKSLTTINGGVPITWHTTTLSSYYLKLTVSGGTPAIDPSYNDNIVTYGFIVYSIITVNYPISVEVPNRELIVNAEVSK